MNHASSRRIKPLQPARRPLLRSALLAAGAWLLGSWAQAQTVAPNVAVPFYTPGHFMQGVLRYGYAPQAADFARQAAALPGALAAWCAADAAADRGRLQQARAQWQASTSAWDRLNGVQIGPLVQRRSARQIDFTPTRPELIVRAIQAAPADSTAMESIGTPAKGLPALEWLLWTQPISPGTPACRYAVQVAVEIAREGAALSTSFSELAARDLSEEEETSVPAMSELVNQWVGGLERLRWAQMEKPRLSGQHAGLSGQHAGQGGRKAAAYPRSASAQTAASWAAQWQALRALAIAQAREAPQPGAGLVPLETYLRGRGLNTLANKLRQNVNQATQSLQNLTPANQAGLSAATRALAALKKLAETEIAPALEVHIGFSDADGD